jgi:hypothetical protein
MTTDTVPTPVSHPRANGHRPALADTFTITTPTTRCDIDVRRVAPVSQRRWYTPLLALDLDAMWPGMVVAFTALLGIGFTMSFHGLYVFGKLVMNWSPGLCALAPIGIDVFSILALLGTFLTRSAERRIRAYVWTVFAFSVALSVAGNALAEVALATRRTGVAGLRFDGSAEQLSALVGAAVWPVFYAVALHTLIVVRRAIDRKRAAATAAAAAAADAARVEEGLEVRAVRLAAAGGSVASIREELGLPESDRRKVERWTKDIRDALRDAQTKPTTTARKAQR